MNLFACCVSLANVMTEPSHKSELHTQLFYGDYVKIIGEPEGLWYPIELWYDGTSGWVLRAQLTASSKEYSLNTHGVVAKEYRFADSPKSEITLTVGSILPIDFAWNIGCALKSINNEGFVKNVIESILSPFVNTPYVWGGVTHFGIDCSGLSKVLYRHFGHFLPSVAAIQIQSGEVIDFLQNVKCGDLAFFHNEEGHVNHVGIMLSQNEIIHASETNGLVAIDDMDQEGIYNRKLRKRTHRLKIIKRIIDL